MSSLPEALRLLINRSKLDILCSDSPFVKEAMSNVPRNGFRGSSISDLEAWAKLEMV